MPYEPYLLEKYRDPTLGVGLVALKRLMAGAQRGAVVESLRRYYGCEPKTLLKAMLKWEKLLAKHGHGDDEKRTRIEEELAASGR